MKKKKKYFLFIGATIENMLTYSHVPCMLTQ